MCIYSICTHKYVYIHMYICAHTYVYTYIVICMYVCIYIYISVLGVLSLRPKATIRRTHVTHADEPSHYGTHLACGGTLSIGIRISTRRQAISTLCPMPSARSLPLPRSPLRALQRPLHSLWLHFLHQCMMTLLAIQVRLPRRRLCQFPSRQ